MVGIYKINQIYSDLSAQLLRIYKASHFYIQIIGCSCSKLQMFLSIFPQLKDYVFIFVIKGCKIN